MRLLRRRPEQPVCGCGHHLAMHDLRASSCHHTTALYNETRETILNPASGTLVRNTWRRTILMVPRRTLVKTVQCGCLQYIGPDHLALYTSPLVLPPLMKEER